MGKTFKDSKWDSDKHSKNNNQKSTKHKKGHQSNHQKILNTEIPFEEDAQQREEEYAQ